MPVSYDPILLKKIAQIYTEADDAFMAAFERAAAMVLRGWIPIEEEPKFLTLANEFGRDAVLAALPDVRQIRLETFEKVFGEGAEGLRHLINEPCAASAMIERIRERSITLPTSSRSATSSAWRLLN